MQKFIATAICILNIWPKLGQAQTQDTVEFFQHYEKFKQYYLNNDLSNAYKSIQEAEKIARKLNIRRLDSKVYKMYGLYYDKINDTENGINNLLKAYKIDQQIKDIKGISSVSNNLALMYRKSNNIPEAIKYAHEAWHADRQLNDKNKITQDYILLGQLYMMAKQYEDAEKNFNNGLEWCKQLKDPKCEVILLNNLAIIYYTQKQYVKAIEYITDAIKIGKTIKTSNEISIIVNNLEKMYNEIKTKYLSKNKNSTELQEEDKKIIESKIKETEKESGIKIAIHTTKTSANDSVQIKKLKDTLLSIKQSIKQYIDSGNYQKVVQIYATYEQLIDSINKMEIRNKEIISRIEKERAIEKVKQEEQRKQDKYKLYAVAAVLFISLLFLGYVLFQYKQKNQILKKLEEAYHEIQIKNKTIIQSINYAQRIQKALLPSKDTINNCFPENFIIYLPKDIVSGDFYWVRERNNNIIVAVADCTGHGVPGAFLSLLSMSLLDYFWAQKIYSLKDLNNLLIESLNEKLSQYQSEIKDSIELSLMTYNLITKDTRFFTTHTPIFMADPQSKSIQEIKTKNEEILIKVNGDEQVFMFSDGLPDQKGGDKKQKLYYSILKEKILSHLHQPISQQELFWNTFIQDWKKNTEQRDDITLVSVKL